MTTEKHSSAKYLFYYLLALITLNFTAIGIGQILFQIINISFPETTFTFDSSYSQSILRFGISAVIVASPIFYFITKRINKDLEKGILEKDAGMRKWLTYIIILAASSTVIGFFIGLINSYLSGEMTIQFFLKALVAIVIATFVFIYYFYDIHRKQFKRDKKTRNFAVIYILIVIAALTSSFFYIDSPIKAKQVREDNERVNDLRNIQYALENYYTENNNNLPENISEIEGRLFETEITDPTTKNRYEYTRISNKAYSICATFALSDKPEDVKEQNLYRDKEWVHGAGKECFERKILSQPTIPVKAIPQY